MSLIRRPQENKRKRGGLHPPDIRAEIAIARYEYGIPAPRKPIARDEGETPKPEKNETDQNA